MRSFLIIIAVVFSIYALDKYTIPYAASDTMTKANFNSNHDTIKFYMDKIIDTLNLNVPRYSQNSYTHDDTMPYLILDTLRGNTDIDTITGNPYIDSLIVSYLKRTGDTTFTAPCSLYDNATYRGTNDCLFMKQGNFVTITFGGILGTCSGSTPVYVRSAGNIDSALTADVGTRSAFPYPIRNNGTDEIGLLRIYDGYIVVLTSAEAALTAGSGGIRWGEITYRYK